MDYNKSPKLVVFEESVFDYYSYNSSYCYVADHVIGCVRLLFKISLISA